MFFILQQKYYLKGGVPKVAELISTFGIGSVIIILLIGIPAIVNFITWCKKLWSSREQFRQDSITQGRNLEAREEAEEHRFSAGESRMKTLETDVTDLKNLITKQQALIELLIQSDELDIKSWIKMQHEKWIPRGCIDGQTLELLEQRFAIYTKEGGNSWAEKLMNELRALPVIIAAPVDRDNLGR